MTSESHIDNDFWEFVSCAKCHLPYDSEPGKSVPFWLTECGHVICNHHLSLCLSCLSSGLFASVLQILTKAVHHAVPLGSYLCHCNKRLPDADALPLARTDQVYRIQLDAPMSEWFRSIPSALDVVAYAAKVWNTIRCMNLHLKSFEFQQEVMARQIRFYRSRHQQIRTVIEKLRSENSELKRTNELLTHENDQLKQQFGCQGFPSEENYEPSMQINTNGKRSLGVSAHQYEHSSRRPRLSSSPPGTTTTPTRLTFPAGQHAPELTHPKENPQHVISAKLSAPQSHHGSLQGHARPVSRQIGKFAYIPPATPRTHGFSPSQTQSAPKPVTPNQSNPESLGDMSRANAKPQWARQPLGAPRHISTTQQTVHSGSMGPPPIPQTRLGTPAVPPFGVRPPASSSGRFAPSQTFTRPQQLSTSHGPQRFYPKTSGNNHSGMRGSWQPNLTGSNSSGGPPGAGYG